MFKNKLVKIGLIILAGVVVLYLVNSYNSENAVVDQVVEEQFAAGGSCGHLPKEEKEVLSKIIKEEMENVFELKVPLVVDLGAGKNWLEAH